VKADLKPMTFADSKERFSNRVADYVRYRPGYPAEVIEALRSECGLRPGHSVADVGSGTGFLSELFLKNGNHVYGVEPNEAMRQAGEEYLASYDNFTSVNGSAEATTLDEASVDFVTAGQAFHWFEPEATRREFLRILKPSGWVLVIWNDRRISKTPFGLDYENLLLRFGIDYARVRAAYPQTQDMTSFFGEGNFRLLELHNEQTLDHDGLVGRLCSSSCVPKEGHPNYAPMIAEVERIFQAHAANGNIRMEYTTQMYFGHLGGKTEP
jgi:ubiquinone/menaquinone biosynthesis C-methylase UbiE